ncbi:MAG: hypothetical protein J5497_01035, partial [Selenomonadaceae bacterium]|nr:hypothetical protein [Selenomonadaceae bacterium]
MPKTRDAFAFKTLSYILKNTIGEFSIPKFDYAPCSDDDDGEEFQAFCAISDWLNVSDSDMPPYRGTLRVEYILDESTKKLQKLQSSLDFIDVHIVRLRRYLLSVSKKITSSADLSSRAALELKRERA